jgi:hypothetical protein
MTPQYRTDYAGEFVVTKTIWSGGKKQQEREWIPNTVDNQHISGRAVCIISEIDRDQFNYTILNKHRGGLLGSKKVQTYGSGYIAGHTDLNFTVETDIGVLGKLAADGYHHEHIVYTSPKHCLAHPGMFHVIPYNPQISLPALVPYLAAFDGHKEIFLLGYTNQASGLDPAWKNYVPRVINAYKEVKFYAVGRPHEIPSELMNLSNVEQMGYRSFISHCDI